MFLLYHLDVIEESRDLFLELSERYPVYILSNFQDGPFDKLVGANSFMRKARGMVVSGKVNMMKPELGIYRYLLDTYDLVAGECFFIDDLVENIEACWEVGMKGVVFDEGLGARGLCHNL